MSLSLEIPTARLQSFRHDAQKYRRKCFFMFFSHQPSSNFSNEMLLGDGAGAASSGTVHNSVTWKAHQCCHCLLETQAGVTAVSVECDKSVALSARETPIPQTCVFLEIRTCREAACSQHVYVNCWSETRPELLSGGKFYEAATNDGKS